ncbi:MAG: serine protease [Candidatus Obscuribacterales bacterium]|nr:serine protease [Candidatus Obscuribacterales bacterium]
MPLLDNVSSEKSSGPSVVGRLAEEAYERPLTTAAVVAGAALASRSAFLRMTMRSPQNVLEALSPAVFYVESKAASASALNPLSQGTGFLLSNRGHVATAYHVVKDAAEITLFNKEGRDFAARLLAFDSKHDIAILQLRELQTLAAKPVKLAGNPSFLGSRKSLTLGHPNASEVQVSEAGSFISERTISKFEAEILKRPEIEGTSQLVLDMTVKPGNSGSPLSDLRGRVFGIVTEGSSKISSTRGAPASKILALMKENGIKGV